MHPLAHARSAAVVVVAGLLLVPAAAAIRSSTSGPALTGDAAGLELARQVNRSYASVPGVRLVVTDPDGVLFVRFTLVLREGVVVAAQALVNEGGAKRSLLVRRESQGTFVRDPDHSCWRFVPAGDAQALTDVGKPMLSGPARVSRPRVAGDTMTMTLNAQGQTARYVDDRKTSRLLRIDVTGLIARYTSLATRPTLPVPKPRC